MEPNRPKFKRFSRGNDSGQSTKGEVTGIGEPIRVNKVSPLTDRQPLDYILSMFGKIRTKEKCSQCGGEFEWEPLRGHAGKTALSRYRRAAQ